MSHKKLDIEHINIETVVSSILIRTDRIST
jgi:hypothetical protein